MALHGGGLAVWSRRKRPKLMGEVIWGGLTASRRRAVTLWRYCVRGGISNFAVASRKIFPPFGNKLSPEPIFLSRRKVMPLPSRLHVPILYGYRSSPRGRTKFLLHCFIKHSEGDAPWDKWSGVIQRNLKSQILA